MCSTIASTQADANRAGDDSSQRRRFVAQNISQQELDRQPLVLSQLPAAKRVVANSYGSLLGVSEYSRLGSGKAAHLGALEGNAGSSRLPRMLA